MKTLQIYIKEDNLRDYKIQKAHEYGRMYFFHGQVNGTIDIARGEKDNNNVTEKIITDGKLSLTRVNSYAPQVIWNEELITLDNGESVAIEIEGATYFVCIIHYGNKTSYEIHVEEERKEEYDKILEYLSQRIDVNTLFFTSPNEVILNNDKKKVLFNFKTGKERIVK